MVKISSISVLGFLLMIIPFTAFPQNFTNFLYITLGAIILILSLLIRRELHNVLRILHGESTTKSNTFSESNPQQEQK